MPTSPPIFDAASLEIVSRGLGFSEGPVAMPDGSVLLVDIKKECLTRVRRDGTQELVARIPGGPNGIAFGVIAYVALKLVKGQAGRADWLMILLATLFAARFVWLASG